MRHRKHTFKIGKKPAHRRSMLANMVCSLFKEEGGRITTTLVRAKEARRLAEKMITLGKKGDLHSRRRAISKMRSANVVNKLFEEIAPEYKDRNGGYTRIIRLGQRRGDAAEMAILALIKEPVGGAVEEVTAEPEAETVAETVEPPVAEEAVEETAEATETPEAADKESGEEEKSGE